MSDRPSPPGSSAYDFVVVGSGFGGSVAALRLAEKGYSVAVLERGRRFADDEFPSTNWNLPDYLWLPRLGLTGFMEMTFLKDVLALRGCGVGGGSLVYANVLVQPGPEVFRSREWAALGDWQAWLSPHYDVARRMLGVATNPRLGPADEALRAIARRLHPEGEPSPTEVAVFFGEPGITVADPYFGGIGPPRAGCTFCGGCMVGCRENAKNTLEKNYLYLAERLGTRIIPMAEVRSIEPLGSESWPMRYRVGYRRPGWGGGETGSLVGGSVIVAAGAYGSVELLLRCRDQLGSLPRIPESLGERVRTNSEALLGSAAMRSEVDFSEGVAITSQIQADAVTHVQPVRYPAGSSFIRVMSVPLVDGPGPGLLQRGWGLLLAVLRRPMDFLREKFGRGWSQRTTILLVMQSEDNLLRFRWRRRARGLLGSGLTSSTDVDRPAPSELRIGHQVAREFAALTGGAPQGSLPEVLLNMSVTAHLLGGAVMGRSSAGGGGRQAVPGVRSPRAVRGRRLGAPGEPRNQPEPDHHRRGRACHGGGSREGHGGGNGDGLAKERGFGPLNLTVWLALGLRG